MASDPYVGRRIRDYEVLEHLGRGGMGTVYRVRHVWLGQERALKIARPSPGREREVVERFLREARALAGVDSVHVVRLFELAPIDDAETGFFMAMELAQGETVACRLARQGRFVPAVAVRIVRDAALGLA